MSIDIFSQNPIDIVEDVIHNKNCNFSRSDAHELVADIYTNMCQYRLYFNWSESLKSINFTVTFDIKFPLKKHSDIYELLAKINEKLWIGHFDITSKSGILAYRQTFFLPHENDMLFNQLEDLVTSKGDWFISADGAQKISPSDKKCLDLKSSDSNNL